MTNYDGQQLCGTDDTLAASVQMCRWPLPDVSWAIIDSLPGFASESFRQAAELAWSYWSAVCGIRPRFVVGSSANIVMGVQTLGPGGILADSELPCGATMNSRLRQRYDTAEAWTIAENPPPNKVDIVRVICHELGHALGCPHIGNANSGNLMSPVYSSQIRKPRSGDIAEMVARYGLQATPPPPPPTGDYVELVAILQKDSTLFVRKNGVISPL